MPGSDPIKKAAQSTFVQVPLDVVLAYFFRAKKCVAALPSSRRLACLQGKDVEERSEYGSPVFGRALPHSVVIKQVVEARDGHRAATVHCPSVTKGPTDVAFS